MNSKNSQKVTFITVIAFVIVLALVIIGIATNTGDNKTDSDTTGSSLEDLYNNLPVTLNEDVSLKKGSINLSDSSLYDELPEIDKYPTVVDGTGQVDIEIFTSG